MMKLRAHLGHLVIDEGVLDAALDRGSKAAGATERSMPQRCEGNRRGEADGQRKVAPLAPPEGECPREDADREACAERRPQIGPKDAHAVTLASSRQPMSR